MAKAHILGFPRIGAQRELKFAVESFWRGDTELAALQETGQTLRRRHWAVQADAGLDFVSVGDFAWYDQVLNTLALLGAVPTRFNFDAKKLALADYFTLARGNPEHFAMEMTKWFDTNYHYLVPEFTADVRFDGGVDWLFEENAEAVALGHKTKVTLVGPLTLLYLGKIKSGVANKLDLLPKVIAGYQNVLRRLQAAGVEWVQIDEPILALELAAVWRNAFAPTYEALSTAAPKLLLATYFDQVREHSALLRSLPVAGVHLDLVRGAGQLDTFLQDWPQDRVLSAGIVDGRNIWRADLDAALTALQPLQEKLGDKLWVSASCSLLHVPVDLANENMKSSKAGLHLRRKKSRKSRRSKAR
jgi:5-methyltetrahydropteroyltriglutamate--homocysteine methyltransferase